IGSGLKEEFGLSEGDVFDLVLPGGQRQEVTVTGLFDLKLANLNKSWVLTGQDTVRSLFDLSDDISTVEIQVADVFTADAAAEEIENRIDRADLTVKTGKTTT